MEKYLYSRKNLVFEAIQDQVGREDEESCWSREARRGE